MNVGFYAKNNIPEPLSKQKLKPAENQRVLRKESGERGTLTFI